VLILWDLGISVALLFTPQFVTRMEAVESQTDWRSGQFKRRARHWTKLPKKLASEDCSAVAHWQLPEADRPSIDLVAGYAHAMRYPLDAIESIVEEAGRLALAAGRRVGYADVEKAIKEFRVPLDIALTTDADLKRQAGSYQTKRQGGRGRGARTSPAVGGPAAVSTRERGGAQSDFDADFAATNRLENRSPAPVFQQVKSTGAGF
jgi:hypothetical protein